jgi:NADPH-dependent 2,4-dienoyl-CoA reductase/sulfur reductase-like enzyme
MNHSHVKYLLIGGGLASASAAEAIRKHDPDGRLLLIAQEVYRPYQRPPLSKEYLRGQKPQSEIFTAESHWFDENQVELHTGRRVVSLETARSSASLDDGQEVSFDRALIATGGSPAPLKIPGANLPNVYYVRRLDDANHLRNAVEKAKKEGRPHDRGRGRAVVIGAGFLGVELAASLTQMGLQVTLVSGASWPWDKIAGESTGRYLTRFLQKRGVNVITHQRPTQFEGDGRVQRVVLPDADPIDCDLVIPSVGMIPHTELTRGTPILAEKAILVDQYARTSVPNIYAAGDCCAIFDPLFAKHRTLDHWDNAVQTGTLAGTNMAGIEQKYDAINNFFSDVFELTLNGWGEARQVHRRILRGLPNGEAPDFAEIGIDQNNRVVQVLCLNHTNEDDALRNLVARKQDVSAMEQALKDPSTPIPDSA